MEEPKHGVQIGLIDHWRAFGKRLPKIILLVHEFLELGFPRAIAETVLDIAKDCNRRYSNFNHRDCTILGKSKELLTIALFQFNAFKDGYWFNVTPQVFTDGTNRPRMHSRTAFRSTNVEEGFESFYIGTDVMTFCRFTKEMDYNGFSSMISFEGLSGCSTIPLTTFLKLFIIRAFRIGGILNQNFIFVFAYDFLITSENVQDMKVDRHF
jgi:hypothetical protein